MVHCTYFIQLIGFRSKDFNLLPESDCLKQILCTYFKYSWQKTIFSKARGLGISFYMNLFCPRQGFIKFRSGFAYILGTPLSTVLLNKVSLVENGSFTTSSFSSLSFIFSDFCKISHKESNSRSQKTISDYAQYNDDNPFDANRLKS